MKIAVNTRLLLKDRLEGIGWFTYETLKRIAQKHTEHEFIFMFDREYSDEFIFSSNINPVIVRPPARHPTLWYLWLEYSVPRVLKKYNADLFLSPDGFLSLSTDIPSLNVIHDINFFHRPEDVPFVSRKYYNHYFPLFARKAKRIGTVSEYSKNDICESYNIDADKIDVLYNGSNNIYSPLSNEEKEITKKNYSQDCEYFVFIGSLHPRKNVPRLLKAFDSFRKTGDNNIKLVIVGSTMWKNAEMKKILTSMEYRNEVIFTGRLSPGDLHKVLGAALALTFVPTFEGFGIPVLEAMYCDTPVLTSDATSIPEVGGDAVLYADPYSVDSIKDGMVKISGDKELRGSLIEKAGEQRKKFSWDKSADNLWKCIEKCM